MAIPTLYKTSVSVKLPTIEETQKIIGSFNSDKFLNIFYLFAASEDLYKPMMDFGKAVFATPDIDKKHREIILLRLAVILNVPYEWNTHKILARNAGLSEEEIKATTVDDSVSGIHPDYVLICEAIDQMALKATLTDETLQKLLNHFGNKLTIQYIITISSFCMVSIILNSARVPLDEISKISENTTVNFENK